MADVAKSLRLLFDRPAESLITPKGDKKSIFQLSSEYLKNTKFADIGVELNKRYGQTASEIIPLMDLVKIPKFPKASLLPLDADFSLFLPKHQKMADEVINVLLNVPENALQEFLSTCVFARLHLNSLLFNYSFTVALMNRKDTSKISIPSFAETFPSKFLSPQVFRQTREAAAVIPQDIPRTPIIMPVDYTANDLDEEHRLAYWREDIGVNLHHWHWHLVYPTSGTRKIVAKDRRGELFYYMHQQIIARYNCERLCNSLRRVKKFNNWREAIPEAYFPKMDTLTASRGWPARQSDMRWKNLNRPVDGLQVTIDQMDTWRKNIEEAIATGNVILPDGTTMSLDIDILGNLVEASSLSPNRQLYGSIHNNGHSFCAYMHDPDNRYLETFGPMGDVATAMRDPFFYRWHSWVDEIFQKYKESPSVGRYTLSELENPGVQVTSADIVMRDGQVNMLSTHWMHSDVDLARGLDFSDRGPVYVRFTHLNHCLFKYVINVNNTGSARRTTVRIFIAPKFDERKQAWALADQRKMFIQMDRFVTPLNAGLNTITRESSESTYAIPFDQSFRDLSRQGAEPDREELAAFNYCGCGWPQHLMVPKGTEGGAAYQLFVMLSNYELDKVEQPEGGQMSCVEASSFCGLKDRKYPDRRAMGFPFDRPSAIASNIEGFILPNMALQDITIRHHNMPMPNPKNAAPS